MNSNLKLNRRNVALAASMLILILPLVTKALSFGGGMYSLLWGKFLNLFNRNPAYLFTLGIMASLGLPFWGLILLFMSLDLWGKPQFLMKFKIQPNKNVPVSWSLYKKCIKVININQVISTVLILMMYPVTQWREMPYMEKDLPTPSRLLMEFVYFVIVQEIGFYYLHRLMHHPLLYKKIHKVHHEWTAPISMAVVYVHPIEHIIVNMVPILLSPVLIGAHLSSTCLWYVTATYVSTIHHSGYHLPGMPSPQFHDFHHLKFNQCFGTIGLLDWFHNTDELFRKTKNFQNDRVFFALQPINCNQK